MMDLLASFYPGPLKDYLRQLLVYNGVEYDVEIFLGSVTAMVLGLSCVFSVILSVLAGVLFSLVFFPLSIFLLAAVYVYLLLRANKRGDFVGSILPDFLDLVSSNLKNGLSINKALLASARPEFDFFQEEILRVLGAMSSGSSFDDALVEMKKRIKSRDFETTIRLIVQGMSSGGDLSAALSKVGYVLRERNFVYRQIKTEVHKYVSFIAFAVLVGAPMLYGISSFLIDMLSGLSAVYAANTSVMGGISASSSDISSGFVEFFCLAALLSTSIMSSIVIGLIKTGEWRNGLRCMPFFCVISLGLFYLINKALVMSMGGILPH